MRPLKKIKHILTRNDAVVLMYHRIGENPIDPWQLSVSETNFEQQLKILKNRFNVVSLDELLNQIANSEIKNKNICITFDDGYFDNFSKAAPLLKKYNCPATFFIANAYTNQPKLFWWDLLTEIFLNTELLPGKLELGPFNFTLENNGHMTTEQFELHKLWKYPHPARTQRSEIYLTLWQYLKSLPVEEITANINLLTTWSEININDESSMPMKDKELAILSSEELFSLGAHTANHPALGSQSIGEQRQELVNSRDYLHAGFTNYLDAVAYPYGHYNEETLSIMRSEKFKAGFTTEERVVNIKSNIYELGRFQVKNWNGSEFKDQLNKWFSN